MAELLAALDGVVASLKGEQRIVDAGTAPSSAAPSPFQVLLSARRAEAVEGALAQWVAGATVDRSPTAARHVAQALRPGMHAPLPDGVAVQPSAGPLVDSVRDAVRRAEAVVDAVMAQSPSGASVPTVPATDVDGAPPSGARDAVWAPIDGRESADKGGEPVLSAVAASAPTHLAPAAAAAMAAVDGTRASAIPAPSGQALPGGVHAQGLESVPVAAGAMAVADAVAADAAAAAPLAPSGAPEARPMAGEDVSPAVQGARALESLVRTGETRVQLALETPLRVQAFAAELSEKLVWLAGRQGQWAALSLNPPHLGSVEVRLALAAGEASAQFFSAQPAVRDALEAALPRLRELMAGAGIQLGDAQVRDEAFSRRDDAPRFAAVSLAIAGLGASPAGEAVLRYQTGSGLIDLYA